MRLPTPDVPGHDGRRPGGGPTGVLLLTVGATVGATARPRRVDRAGDGPPAARPRPVADAVGRS
ncbi:hypothetical protein ACQSSU_16565 [Micromonospora echinospora]